MKAEIEDLEEGQATQLRIIEDLRSRLDHAEEAKQLASDTTQAERGNGQGDFSAERRQLMQESKALRQQLAALRSENTQLQVQLRFVCHHELCKAGNEFHITVYAV